MNDNIQTDTQTQTRTHTQTHMKINTKHTHTHIQIQTHTHQHSQTNTHLHTQASHPHAGTYKRARRGAVTGTKANGSFCRGETDGQVGCMTQTTWQPEETCNSENRQAAAHKIHQVTLTGS